MIGVAAADGAHEVDGIHRCFGARVVESPHRQTEPAGQLAGDDDRVVGRLGEVRALRDPTLHGLDDRRVGMAGDHHAVATVQVDVLGAVDVPHVTAAAVADPHRSRAGDHPVRGRAAGEHLGGLLTSCDRLGHTGQEAAFLLVDQRIDRDGFGFDDGHFGLSLSPTDSVSTRSLTDESVILTGESTSSASPAVNRSEVTAFREPSTIAGILWSMTTESAFVAVVERMRRDTADRNPASRAEHERARAVLPGGSTRSILHHAPFPLTFVKGDGGTLTDADGHSYVDLVGDYTAGLLGPQREARARGRRRGVGDQHQRRRRAPRRDPIRRTRVQPLRPPARALHQLRHRSKPDGPHAVEDRHRAIDDHGDVRRLPRRRLLLLARQCAVERSVPHHRRPVQRPRRLRGVDRRVRARTSPRSSSSRCSVPDACRPMPRFLSGLANAAQQAGAIFITDEVMTSRHGPRGLADLLGVRPDIATFGKYFAGGFSFGAFAGRADLLDRFDATKPDAIPHAGTFNNNIATMSAGCVVLSEIFTSDTAITLTARGEELRGRIDDVLHQHKLPLTITGFGSMNAVHALERRPTERRGPAGARPVATGGAVPGAAAPRRVHGSARQPQPRTGGHRVGSRSLPQRARRIARRAQPTRCRAGRPDRRPSSMPRRSNRVVGPPRRALDHSSRQTRRARRTPRASASRNPAAVGGDVDRAAVAEQLAPTGRGSRVGRVAGCAGDASATDRGRRSGSPPSDRSGMRPTKSITSPSTTRTLRSPRASTASSTAATPGVCTSTPMTCSCGRTSASSINASPPPNPMSRTTSSSAVGDRSRTPRRTTTTDLRRRFPTCPSTAGRRQSATAKARGGEA